VEGPQNLQVRADTIPWWEILIFHSLTTIIREFGALQALSLYDLCDEVLRPKPARIPRFSDGEIKMAMKAYEVNEPQANAILSASKTTGFALVQG
jgi:senataxin